MTVIPMPHKLDGMIDERTLLFAHLDATHAGHLDLAREHIDGHQHLVVE